MEFTETILRAFASLLHSGLRAFLALEGVSDIYEVELIYASVAGEVWFGADLPSIVYSLRGNPLLHLS